MYPDWPLSSADLVPLPRCDGPKLKPFDFQGAQAIEFLDYLGEGLHAYAFKVRIRGQIYALKLVGAAMDGCILNPESADSAVCISSSGSSTTMTGSMLGDITRLQQLGIMHIDPACRQLVGGKICDFSTAITVPHFVTTPELNPGLTPEMRIAMERNTFLLSIEDYLAFDEMMFEWNYYHADKKGTIAVRAFPGGRGPPLLQCHKLGNKAARERVFTYVDPRRYNWKWQPKGKNKCRRRLLAKPSKWVYCCGENGGRLVEELRNYMPARQRLRWDYKDGLFFPRVGG
ncbi:hypothetical protein QQZ08_005135 [Neonectria magnoliae]|uniref:Uncharacterized protein n=1 Tax=Neonectria magnoliae TaxID=2732573 RepID=A0ABR1I4B1_9HYPO